MAKQIEFDAAARNALVRSALRAVNQDFAGGFDAVLMQVRQSVQIRFTVFHQESDLLNQPCPTLIRGNIGFLGGLRNHEVMMFFIEPEKRGLSAIRPLAAVGYLATHGFGVELERPFEVGY